jgi:hypothetical protein
MENTSQKKANYRVDAEKPNEVSESSAEILEKVDSASNEEVIEKERDVIKVQGLETRSTSGGRDIDTTLAGSFKPDLGSFNMEELTKEYVESLEAGPKVKPFYFIFEKLGDKNRGVFLGFTELAKLDKEGKKLTAAVFGNHEGFWMNSGAALVGDLADYAILGEFYEIELVEKSKTKEDNNVFIYTVRQLYKAKAKESKAENTDTQVK